MNDHEKNEDSKKMLADAWPGPLEREETADLTLLADLLADPATWAEPRAGLEDDVVSAVVESRRSHPSRRLRRSWLAASAAVAASIAIVAGIATTQGGAHADYAARLNATSLAPTARATAALEREDAGFRVDLDAHALPRLAAAEYYQAWLKNAGGTSVPIGTFSSGEGHVTLWSGVSPETFSTMTVTIEAADNNQASSGRVVLAGGVHRR